jgi:hypothetical protein
MNLKAFELCGLAALAVVTCLVARDRGDVVFSIVFAAQAGFAAATALRTVLGKI